MILLAFLLELNGLTCEHCFADIQHRSVLRKHRPCCAENVIDIVHINVCSRTKNQSLEYYTLWHLLMTIPEIFLYVLKNKACAQCLQRIQFQSGEKVEISESVWDQTMVVNTKVPLRGIANIRASGSRGLHQRCPSSMVLQREWIGHSPRESQLYILYHAKST
jgi:hypothetical protein